MTTNPNQSDGLLSVEKAWRDGWAECKSRLTEDEAFRFTEDVEEDA